MLYLYILALIFMALVVGVILGIVAAYTEILIKKDWKDAVALATWQPFPYIGYCDDGPLSKWFYRKTINGYDGLFERNKLGLAWQKYWLDKAKLWSPVRLVKDEKEYGK